MTKKSRMYKNLNYVDPAPISQMTLGRGRPNTVCDVLRRIYNLTDNEEVKLLARIATTMTRKMDYKLAEYKEDRAMGSKNKQKRRESNKGKRLHGNKAKRKASKVKKAN